MIVANIENHDAILIDFSIHRIDASNSDALYRQVIGSLYKSKNIIIDLSTLEVMDSSGLGMLLNCYREIKATGGNLSVVAGNPLVLSLFQLVHFNKITKIYRTVPKAVECLKAS